MEDRNYFDLKHNAHAPSKEEEVYRSLADYEHNELPIHKFKRDHIWDDPRINGLLVDALKGMFSGFGPTDEVICNRFKAVVREAFRDYVSMQPEDE